jgi:mRNA-degrading endonuclease RelE of RelBE toxin-antitoxin system
MQSFTTRRFRDSYGQLPAAIQQQARRTYQLFRENPAHPSLNFKEVDDNENIYSVRIGRGYRALGKLDGAEVVWFWIGAHSEYDKLI